MLIEDGMTACEVRLLKRGQEGAEREDIANYTGHITQTKQYRTEQHKRRSGTEREGQASEVESENRAEGISACDDYMVVFLQSNLWSIVQVFLIVLKRKGV